MRKVLPYFLIAVIGGLAGAGISKSGEIYERAVKHLSSEPQYPAGFWSTPEIEGYGKIHYAADAGFKPFAGLSNKIVFHVSQSEGAMEKTNPGLERVARVVNLYVASGIPVEKLQFVVTISSAATPAVLNNAHFRQIYGTDNPNLPLIAELEKRGIKVTVCDQSVAFHHYENARVHRSVERALSSLTTVSTLENQGYALLKL